MNDDSTKPEENQFIWSAIGLWGVVGVLSGVVLGLALGFRGRPLVFFGTLGLGIAWFGISGLLRRSGAPTFEKKTVDTQAPQASHSPSDKLLSLIEKATRVSGDDVKEEEGEDEVLRGDSARKWLDTFLQDTQRKK